MSDIDFDELDKAVNSLMANVDTSKRSAGLDDPEDKTVTLSDTSQAKPIAAPVVSPVPAPAVSVDTKSDEAPAVQPEVGSNAPAAALAVKRRGQFMDVMHPSSDMKSASRPVKREGVTVAPAAAASAATEVAPASEPINEFAISETSEVTAPESTITATDDAAEQAAPLTSPFLPDAKPEKRPLGAAASETPAPTVDLEAELNGAATVDAAEDAGVEAPAQLPEELGSDVLAIESNSIPAAVESDTAAELPVEPAVEAVPEEPAAVPAGGSIPQQYTEAPSSGDQTNGSIYDTSNYHQPIEAAPAAKKSSPLKWILLAVGLLVLGGGGGVAYFLLTH